MHRWRRHSAILWPCWDQDLVPNASYAGAKCSFTAKSSQDQMTAPIGIRLTLLSFKHENRKIFITRFWRIQIAPHVCTWVWLSPIENEASCPRTQHTSLGLVITKNCALPFSQHATITTIHLLTIIHYFVKQKKIPCLSTFANVGYHTVKALQLGAFCP